MPVLNLVVCDWLFWPACQHCFCIYVYVLAVFRSGFTAIDIKLLLLLLLLLLLMQTCVTDTSCKIMFLAAAGYPDRPNFGPPPKIRRKNAAAENAAEF